MNVVEDNRLVYPAVGLCYVPDMPDHYLKRACEILAQGCSHPAIFNDDVIAKGLQLYGVPEQDSRRYIHSTCVEVTPEAASNVWVASPYINLVAPLLQTMEEDHETMASFLDAVFVRLDKAIKDGFEDQNESRKWRAERSINPLLSCVVNDCLERGVDIERGGARYNWIMPSFVGMANLADCLNTIDEMVFKQRKYTMTQLRQMTDANFEGYEAQRLELLNKVEKYGNDDDAADCWCNVITDHIVKECGRYTPVLPDARLVPSVFCWVMHEQSIIDEILSRLPTDGVTVFPISLVGTPETLKSHLTGDIEKGIRHADVIERSLAYLPKYEGLQTVKIDVTGLTAEEVAQKISALVRA
jgi:formate C-acetyltransferase